MFSSKLSNNDTSSILLSLEAQLSMGASLPIAIKTLIEIEGKKVGRVLRKADHLIHKKNIEPEKALFMSNIINSIEMQVLSKTQSTKEAIREIVKIRDMAKKFEKTVVQIFLFLVMSPIIGLGIDYFMQPTFYEMYSSLIKQVQVIKGIDLSKDVRMMWYLMDRELVLFLMVVYSLAIGSFLFIYTYYLRAKPYVIYNFLPLKTYDDMPLILYLLKSLKSSGMSTEQALKILSSEKNFSIGLKRIYSKLLQVHKKNRPLYEGFDSIHFPKEVMIWLKTAEMSGSLWDKVDEIIGFINKRNNEKLKFFTIVFEKPMSIAGYLVIIYFLIGIFTSVFTLQRIAMNLA